MTDPSRVAILPCPPALLPAFAGLSDPFPDLREACRAAVAWLVRDRSDPVLVLGPATALVGPGEADRAPRGLAVAEHLLSACGYAGGVRQVVLDDGEPPPEVSGRALLTLGDGSARRGDKAPGHLDERAFAYDAEIGSALRSGDVEALRDLDLELGAALLAEGSPVLRRLAACVTSVETAQVTYDDDPFGVQYWVATWQCRSRNEPSGHIH